jgi:hypothetical protein
VGRGTGRGAVGVEPSGGSDRRARGRRLDIARPTTGSVVAGVADLGLARYSALVVGLALVYLGFSVVVDRRAADALFGTAAGRAAALAGIALELWRAWWMRGILASERRRDPAVALAWGIVAAGAVLGLHRRIEITRRRAIAKRPARSMPACSPCHRIRSP